MRSWLSNKLNLDRGPSSQSPMIHTTAQQNGPLVNAVYYPNWKVYGGQAPSTLVADKISHLFYAFIWPTENGGIAISVDGVAGCMAAVAKLKSTRPHLKTIISIGGGGAGSSKFAPIAASEGLRRTFAQNVRNFVDTHGFNGTDIDWEHPEDPQQGANYVALLAELRRALPSPQYLLTTALPAGEWALKNINLSAAAQYLDMINIMAYDFSGPWTPQVGNQAQLFAPKNPHSDAARISGESAVNYFLSKGVPPYKLILGIPAYGRSFLGASGIGSTFSGQGGEEGTFEYKDLPRPAAIESWDQATGSAYCIGGDGGFVTYDNVQTVQMKGQFVRNRRIGGLFYWTATGDAVGPRSLVVAGYNTLHGQ